MKYGYFDDNNREYVITTPQTPYPWINYLGTHSFFSLISNTAGGYCFYRDARLRRILRYRYNDIPLDNNGRYYYIVDNVDNTEIWNPTWKPMKTPLDLYECRHGLGYTSISATKNGLFSKIIFFVPLQVNAEIHYMQLTNETKFFKRVKVFSFIEFCLWNALDDQTNFQRNLNTAEVEVVDSTIIHKTEYRERRNHYAFYSVNVPICGFDTDRDAFVGLYNGLHEPKAVIQGHSYNSIADGWAPIGSHCIEIELAPGEKRELIFILGYVENDPSQKWESEGVVNKSAAFDIINKFSKTSEVITAIESLRLYWDSILNNFQVKTPEIRLDRMANIWNQYQCIITYNMSRSASYFESGISRGIGFRDSNQDVMGFVHLIADKAKERILDLAATQFEDGSAYHQYQPLTKRGNDEIGSNFNDDPLWLISSVASYIKETSDWSILDVAVPFSDNKTNAVTLFEHLLRSFNHVVNNLGPHGLPLIGRADWNDCLNLNCFSYNPDESFQTCTNKDGKTAESVFIAALFVASGLDLVHICLHRGLQQQANLLIQHIEKMKTAIEKYGWDEKGGWFLRAYDHSGQAVGASGDAEGMIFVEPQGYCIMAGIGLDNGRAISALHAVRKYLDTVHGIMLHNPPYRTYRPDRGEISSYPPGYKENAGIFCHNNPWIIIAETMVGNGNAAFEYYKKICPAYREDISELHRMEPYVYSQMIAGKDSKRHGEAKNSWLTGTASWNFIAVSQYMLGIRPEFEGLRIDPCIPSYWEGFKVIRKFRGAEYRIEVHNPEHVSKGVRSIEIDGIEIKGTLIVPNGKKQFYNVVVTMGT